MTEDIQPGTAILREIAHTVGSIFFHGGFSAETVNERKLESLLRESGYWYDSEEAILAPSPEPAQPTIEERVAENPMEDYDDGYRSGRLDERTLWEAKERARSQHREPMNVRMEIMQGLMLSDIREYGGGRCPAVLMPTTDLQHEMSCYAEKADALISAEIATRQDETKGA